ncbi:type VI secretion system tube protein TssD [Flavobacterium ginsengiterrae]|uniref:Phage tail protein n=1 Tax=Flavobacterium ginsengiterrae TaxID=871695 RepID=A0ABP7H7D0_9FLAO
MSFLAKLQIDGEEFNVLDFNIKFSKEIDSLNKPVGSTKGGTVKITIEANQSTSFLSWMLSSDLTKDGKITFFRRDAMSKMRELVFEKTYCISYYEEFNSTNEIPMIISMELTAKELVFGDAKFFKKWISLT